MQLVPALDGQSLAAQLVEARHGPDIAGDVARAVADTDDADALADKRLRLPVVVRVQIRAGEFFELWDLQRLGQMTCSDNHCIECCDCPVGEFDFPARRFGLYVEGGPDLGYSAAELNVARNAEMLRVCDQIAVHINMIGKCLRGWIEIEIAEACDPARCIDVQGTVRGRLAVVVLVAPHATDLSTDFEHRHIETNLEQVLRRTDTTRSSPDDRNALAAAPIGSCDRRIQPSLIDGFGGYHELRSSRSFKNTLR